MQSKHACKRNIRAVLCSKCFRIHAISAPVSRKARQNCFVQGHCSVRQFILHPATLPLLPTPCPLNHSQCARLASTRPAAVTPLQSSIFQSGSRKFLALIVTEQDSTVLYYRCCVLQCNDTELLYCTVQHRIVV